MSTNNPPPGDRLNIFIEGCAPDSDEQRDRLLGELQAALERLAEAHQLEQDRIRIYDGHTFVQVERRCPRCGADITLKFPEMMENAAYAQAHCESCEWNGTAIYRLIDLMTYESDPNSTMVEGFPFASSVGSNDLEPQYIPYE